MNQEEIKKILPHRDHMLLIDEAELREGKAYGKKTIRGDEFFLQGHFPGNPVVPGVLKTPYTPGMYLKQNVPCSSIRAPSTGQRARAM